MTSQFTPRPATEENGFLGPSPVGGGSVVIVRVNHPASIPAAAIEHPSPLPGRQPLNTHLPSPTYPAEGSLPSQLSKHSPLMEDISFTKMTFFHPCWCGSGDSVLACEPKGCQFDSQSEHMPGLWVSPSRSHTRGNHTKMFLFLPPFPSL
ncbi:hypothetical protein HJG60_010797 [Phyllostomus discolor]|uniref:Uncharacterized protein n=1 Tax=Phyllostomus discolor TaxID=89673 RepID=A0A834ABV5_9CHIR|nr:hypothetical protein HJG60_010797 [Phyllostomus discolor]